MLSNLDETLHSSAKWKNKQVAKIWGLYLKKQRFSDTMQFPEGLENNLSLIHNRRYEKGTGKSLPRPYFIISA